MDPHSRGCHLNVAGPIIKRGLLDATVLALSADTLVPGERRPPAFRVLHIQP
jgi:hypothetical protein